MHLDTYLTQNMVFQTDFQRNYQIENEQIIPITSSVILITLLHENLVVTICSIHLVTKSISSSICSNTIFV